MGFLKNLFGKRKETTDIDSNIVQSSDLSFFIKLDNEIWGPFTLLEIKNNYPILKTTFITTNSLNGEWYEARCFECFDELFDSEQDYYINEFGEIVRKIN